jgi:hypothetical protein
VNPKEVYEVFQPDPRNCKEINEYHFTRIKRGAYEGDLGLIKKIDTESSNVIVFVVPRLRPRKSKKRSTRAKRQIDIGGENFIDDSIDIGSVRTQGIETKKKVKEVRLDSKGRPEPKLFDPKEYDDQDIVQVHPYGGRHMQSGPEMDETNFEYR